MIFKLGLHWLRVALWSALLAFYAVASDEDIELAEMRHLTQKKVQEIVIQTIKESYQVLNNPKWYTTPIYHRKKIQPLLVPGWKVRVKYGRYLGSGSGYCLLIKETDLSVGQALDEAFTGCGAMDDRMAAELVFLQCLHKVFGKDIFDEIAEQNDNNNPIINQIDTQYMGGMTKQFSRLEKGGEPSIGTWVCFPNVECYDKKHPYGMAHHLNAFYVGDDDKGRKLYMGYGPFFTQERTQEEILTYLYLEYCKPSDYDKPLVMPQSYWSICEKLHELYTIPRMWCSEQRARQQLMNMVTFDVDKIMNWKGKRKC